MKLTHIERKRIHDWLNKDPRSEDQGKLLVLRREEGTMTFARTTIYTGEGAWKVRIGFELRSGYPVAMSSPILHNKDHKKSGMVTTAKMVPKFAPPKPVESNLHPVQKGNPGAFQKAISMEMESLTSYYKKQIQDQLNQVSVFDKLWPFAPSPEPDMCLECGVDWEDHDTCDQCGSYSCGEGCCE